jgi:predicted Holliday junction resolvase-like endonuclease
MYGIFAATDPQTTLSSGNAVAILALIVVTLTGVIVYLARKIDVLQRDSAAEIKMLNAQLLAENKAHTQDYREMAKDNQEVLQLNSQSNTLIATKIEAIRGGQQP